MTNYNVGDINSTERGSGARDNKGKVSLSLVPMHLLAGCARVFMGGQLKYASWNWAKGMAWSVAFDCLMRHLFKWWFMHEECDKESGEHHLDHAIANLLMLRHYHETYPQGDDRPLPSVAHFHEEGFNFNTPFDEEAYQRRNPPMPSTETDELWREEANEMNRILLQKERAERDGGQF